MRTQFIARRPAVAVALGLTLAGGATGIATQGVAAGPHVDDRAAATSVSTAPILVADGRYELFDLGTLGGDESYARDINDSGQVVGSSFVVPDQPGQHAFRWSEADGFTDLGTLGSAESQALGINDAGEVVGASAIYDGGPLRAFRWAEADGMEALGTLGGDFAVATDISASGIVTGYAATNPGTSFPYSAFAWTEEDGIAPLVGVDGVSEPVGINDVGQIAVNRQTPGTGTEAFRWDPVDGAVPLGHLGGFWSMAQAITADGTVEGISETANGTRRSFEWTPATGMVDVGPPRPISEVDVAGRWVGTTDPPDSRAVLGDPLFGDVDLGTLGGPHSTATALNRERAIVGWAALPGEVAYHATLWRRVPPCGPDAPGVADDVPGDHAFCAEIEWATDVGIASGYGDGTFRPSAAATRQATAAYLHRLAGEPAPASDDPMFDDVPADHTFFDAIQWMGETGLSTGTPTGTGGVRFDPTTPTSRQAMASFLHRLAGEPAGDPPGTSFADVVANHPFAEAIGWMASSGISTGTPQADGLPLYEPGHSLSRQASVTFLQRFDALPDTP